MSGGLSTYDLARSAGIGQPYLVRLETGQRRLSGALAVRLARALGCGVEDLLVAHAETVTRATG